ncbi:unnamed protein product, partial [marine sediment metagenome]
VTSFIAGEYAGDGVVSILLQYENEGPPEMYVNYNHPYPRTSNPYLEVNYTPLGWTGTATFSLKNLYTVNVEKTLDLYQGSKLVVKFYTYGDGYENENVVETFSPPAYVEENELARHPDNIGVKKARLDLTTDDGNVISTIASYTVTKAILEIRYAEIPGEWFLASPEERIELEREFSEIPGYWFLAPD